MPVNIVTDTDFAGVPFSGDYSFALTEKSRGPFAAMLPLSKLLDPAQEQANIENLATQFKHIPHTTVRDAFLAQEGGHYMHESLKGAQTRGAELVGAKHYIPDILANEYTFLDIEKEVKKYAESAGVNTPEALIEHYVQKTHCPPEEAPLRLLEELQEKIKTGDWDTLRIPKSHTTSAEALAAGEAAKKLQLQKYVNVLGEHGPVFAEAISKPLTRDTAKTAIEAYGKGLLAADAHQRGVLFDDIAKAAKAHNIDKPYRGLESLTANMFKARGHEWSFDELVTARDMAAQPLEAAKHHYAALKADALAKKAAVKVPASNFANYVHTALADCPAHIRHMADGENMNLVVVAEDIPLHHVTPGSAGIMIMQEMAGGSTTTGIYAKPDFLKTPAVLREEIIHEVERTITTHQGTVYPFSVHPEWQGAICHDTNAATQSAAFKDLTKRPIVMDGKTGQMKGNFTISHTMLPLQKGTHDMPEIVRFIESVPDMYHYESIVRNQVVGKGGIKLGGVEYKNVNDAMHAAFPSSWKMLEGPAKGMKLVQEESGKVVEMASEAAVPAGSKQATSLMEHCEQHLGAERGSFIEASQARQSRLAQGEAAAEGRFASGKNGVMQWMAEEKWMGKKGFAVVGATVVVGATIYAAKHYFGKDKHAAQKDWRTRVSGQDGLGQTPSSAR